MKTFSVLSPSPAAEIFELETMMEGLLLLRWSSPYSYSQGCTLSSQSKVPFFSLPIPKRANRKRILPPSLVAATLNLTTDAHEEEEEEEEQQQKQLLTARERRKLRNERRESKAGRNWREEVEERFIEKKPKKKPAPRSAQLNFDTLAVLGPQWWIVRVSRVRGHETADLVARLLARNYPGMEFKVYAPAVHVKRKLKNGTYSVKPKPIFPGCIFLWCVLNKEIHDFIRECDGVGGFVGTKVGDTKRQINRPTPVSDDDMKAIFQQAKEEQEQFDKAAKEEEQDGEEAIKSGVALDSKPKRGSKKSSDPLADSSRKKDNKHLTPGSTVRVVSGTFVEFEGNLKKINRKTGKATVGFTLFGKESLVDLDLNEIVAETK